MKTRAGGWVVDRSIAENLVFEPRESSLHDIRYARKVISFSGGYRESRIVCVDVVVFALHCTLQ